MAYPIWGMARATFSQQAAVMLYRVVFLIDLVLIVAVAVALVVAMVCGIDLPDMG